MLKWKGLIDRTWFINRVRKSQRKHRNDTKDEHVWWFEWGFIKLRNENDRVNLEKTKYCNIKRVIKSIRKKI